MFQAIWLVACCVRSRSSRRLLSLSACTHAPEGEAFEQAVLSAPEAGGTAAARATKKIESSISAVSELQRGEQLKFCVSKDDAALPSGGVHQ